jgi:hypothetical protein
MPRRSSAVTGLAGHVPWDSENGPAKDRDAVETSDSGTLRLAFMPRCWPTSSAVRGLRPQNKAAILRYDRVTLELTTAL